MYATVVPMQAMVFGDQKRAPLLLLMVPADFCTQEKRPSEARPRQPEGYLTSAFPSTRSIAPTHKSNRKFLDGRIPGFSLSAPDVPSSLAQGIAANQGCIRLR